MGTIWINYLQDYWEQHKLFNNKCFGKYMSRVWFLNILRCLHISIDDEKSEDRLQKIWPRIDDFSNIMYLMYYPDKELSLDKSMVL